MPDPFYEFGPQYDFGNGGTMVVRELLWDANEQAVRPQGLELPITDERGQEPDRVKVGGLEWESFGEVVLAEMRDNWQTVPDPDSDSTLEVTVVNRHALDSKDPSVMVRVSDLPIPDHPEEALSLEDDALANPDKTIIHIVRPGKGGSTGPSENELRIARETGRLIGLNTNLSETGGSVVESFDSHPTIKTIARVIDRVKGTKGRVTNIYADGIGAHYASALMQDFPEGSLESAFFLNPTNISDLYSSLTNIFQQLPELLKGEGLSKSYAARLADEMDDNREYADASTDMLAITTERIARVKRIFDNDFHARVAEQRKAAVTPKIQGDQEIYTKGLDRGKAVIYHLIAGLIAHPKLKVSYGISEFASQYESRADISRFMELAFKMGKSAVDPIDLECYELPVSGRWQYYHPQARLALMDRAFSR